MRSLFRAVAPLALTALCLFAQDSKKSIKIKPGAATIGSPTGASIDKVKLEAYLRHVNLWTPEIQVEFKDIHAVAELPGYQEVTARASLGERSAEQKYFISADGKTIIRGELIDADANPFAKEIKLIDNAGHAALGTPGAPVVIALYTDFQCPYCKDQAKVLRENLLTAYPKEVRLYMHDFPLEQIHPWARTAAIAGRCVALQGDDKFWKFHDWAFDKQAALSLETFRTELMAWAPHNGIEVLQLTRCVDTKQTDPLIAADIAAAQVLGLNSTPTLYINGRKLAGSNSWEQLKRIIDLELKYQATAKNAGDNSCCSVTLPVAGAK